MKNTGIVRRLDELGRITLPKELRDVMDIGDRAPLEIHVDGDVIVLRKYVPENGKKCTICGKTEGLHLVNGKHMCGMCITDAYEALLKG